MRYYLIINNLFEDFEALWLKILSPDLKTPVYFFFTHPLLEEATREKRSTDSIEKEPDFVGFGGKSLVKTSIVNINDL